MKELSFGAIGFHRIVLESNHICELREKQKFSLGGLEWNKENFYFIVPMTHDLWFSGFLWDSS